MPFYILGDDRLENIFIVQVKEEDIDFIGHVNYKQYIIFSEQAIMDWFASIGLYQKDLERQRIGLVLLDLHVSYLNEAKLGDKLKIVTSPARLGEKSFDIKQDIYNDKGDHLTTLKKTFVTFDLSTRKSIPVIEQIVNCFNKKSVKTDCV